MLLDRDAPALFGLREAAVIVDLASQCATGLALSNHAEERPGLVASQLFESLRDRADRHAAVPPQEAISRAAGAALDHVRRAAVFGSGAAGRLALDLAARCGWTVPYLVDNNPAVWNTTAHERPVRAPHALWADPVDLVIVGSLAGGPAIASQLEGMGLVIGQDFVHVLDPIRSGGLVTQAYV
jgi:hypothetical protein